MPQVDIRPIFNPPSKPQPHADPDPGVDSALEQQVHSADLSPRPRFRLTGAQWTNLAFIAAACLGAVFSVVYLYDNELVQEVASWPRELFRGRAVSPAQAAQDRALAVTQTGKADSASDHTNSGDPFPAVSTSLRLDRPFRPQTQPNHPPPFSTPTSTFSSLNGAGTTTTEPTSVPNVSNTGSPRSLPNVTSSAAPPAQASAANAAPAEQATSALKSSTTGLKSTAARSVSRTNRAANVRTVNRLTRATGAMRSANGAKTSFFKSLFGPRPSRKTASSRKAATNRTRTTTAARSGKRAIHRQTAQRSQTAGRQKLAGDRSPLGKPAIQASRHAAAVRRSTTSSAITLRSESSRTSSGAAALRSGMPGGVSGGAAGLHSFGHPFGGGMISPGMGGGLGGGRGFGRAGGR